MSSHKSINSQIKTDNNTTSWAALSVTMALPLAAALFYFVLLKESAIAQPVYIATKLFTLIWPIIILRHSLKRIITRIKPDWLRQLSAMPANLFIAIAMIAAILAVYYLPPIKELLQRCKPKITTKVSDMGIKNHFLIFGLFLSIIHSLIEEYYWRWFVFGQLRTKISLSAAVILASLAFAAHHYLILAVILPLNWAFLFGSAVAAAGMIWCLQFQKQKTIIGPWLSHMAADLAIMYIAWQTIS